MGQRKKVTAVTFFPARLLPHQRGINMGQILKVSVYMYEITWFLMCQMVGTRSQFGANNGILVWLVQEIWQFKLFAGKEVTAVPATRGEGGYWRRGKRLLCLCWNWIALTFFKTLEIKWLRTYHRLVRKLRGTIVNIFYHREFHFTAASFILLPRVLFDCREFCFTAASFVLLPRVLFYCREFYLTAASFIFSAASFILLPRDLIWKINLAALK